MCLPGVGFKESHRGNTMTFIRAAAVLAFALAPFAASAADGPIVRVEGLRQISPHVHIIPDNSVPSVSNIGYVIGDKAVLVIDTGLGPPNGAAVYEVAKRLAGSKAIFLVTTHIHPEHDLGAQAFPDTVELIRSTDEIKDIAESGLTLANIFAKRSAINAELLKGADFRKADITFEGEYELDLGGVHAKLSAMGPNHTLGDTAIWIEADRVLFSGDIAMRAQPAFASIHSSRRHWLASLDKLAALKPTIIVPSHGPTGDGSVFIDGYRTYLVEVRDRTEAAKRDGRNLDQTIEAVTAAFGERAPDKGRLAGAIKAAYAEAP
jgi:glyoxylase-like metal-dependent hydrolase (beta-lactamase superfamily II)